MEKIREGDRGRMKRGGGKREGSREEEKRKMIGRERSHRGCCSPVIRLEEEKRKAGRGEKR